MMAAADDVLRLGTILCVFAHPDDETFTMGGIMALAATNGQKVICITATKGEGGVQDEARWPAASLGDIRTAELKAALHHLGVDKQYFLDYRDGTCAESDAEVAAQKIAEFIRQYQPDSIFSFGPDGLTGHPDHQTVSRWAVRARQLAGIPAKLYYAALTPEQYEGFGAVDADFNFFFATENPPLCAREDAAICITLNDATYDKKVAAFKAMPSQYDSVFARYEAAALRGGFGTETFVEAPDA